MLKDFYDESKPIVTLEAFYGPKRKIVDKCLILFSDEIFRHLKQAYPCRKIAEVGGSNGANPVWMLEHQGEKIAFYLSAMGSALAGDLVAEVNHLTGASKFIMFGSCGSLDNAVTEGKVIVPTQAYRGEGMSFYFAPAADYIAIRNADRLAELLSELGVPFVKGRVWTTECMLRETVELVRKRKEEGCIAVEMELAGVQALCDFYGFELYDFLMAGDVLGEEQYENSGLFEANHSLDKLELAFRLAEKI